MQKKTKRNRAGAKGLTSGTGIRIWRRGGGWVAEGPGFYVWDEDRGEVARTAGELQKGNYAVRPARRMLIIQPQELSAPVAGGSSEALDTSPA